MEAEISTRTVVKGQVEIMGGLEGKVKVYDELMVGLFENVGLYDGILQLLLQNQVFLLESFQGV